MCDKVKRRGALSVFSIVGPKQNAGSVMTSVSDTVFYAHSHGTHGFALHGSFFNYFLIGGNSSTAKILRNKLLLKLPRTRKTRKIKVPCERE